MSRSTRKSLSRPISAPSTPHSNWTPQTPHGTRAVQLRLQRSSGANAETNRRKPGKIQKPWSARRTLRALSRAAINEPSRLRTWTDDQVRKRLSRSEDKENDQQTTNPYGFAEKDEDEDEEHELRAKRPRLSLPIDSEGDHEREGTPLPEAPTPSVLRDEDEENENPTLKSVEFGRRAISEGPINRRFSRPSFGSIRMSDFTAADLRDYGMSPEAEGKLLFQAHDAYEDNIIAMGDDDRLGNEAAEDIGDVQETRQSFGFPDVNETTLDLPNVDQEDHDTFRLDFNVPGAISSATEASSHNSHHGSRSAKSSPTPPSPANLTSRHAPSPLRISSRSPSAPPIPSPSNAIQHSLQLSKARKQKYKLSQHNLKVPALPSSLQKRLANSSLSAIGRRKSKVGKDSLQAIEQATEWFFEQVGEDLEAYSNHAGRKKRVDELDVMALMKRFVPISC